MMMNSFGILRRVLTLPFLPRLSIPIVPFKVSGDVLRAISFYSLVLYDCPPAYSTEVANG